MTTIGVITRGKYGNRLIETIITKTEMKVVHTSVPEILPDFIDEPEEFLEELNIDRSVFDSDIVITYSLHPDLTVALAHMAGKAGLKAMIVPGGASKAPVLELENIAKQYGMLIQVEDICCTLQEKPETKELCSCLSSPVLDIDTDKGIIESVEVLCGAPCGSTWHMARELVGTKVEEAPARAGLLIQQYPCRAVRGNMGGIHESGEIHKKAVEEALKRKKEES
ncbi:DUF166 domain-containing protein [Methanolobus mangrovi]|uniref:DUF166 domain-containing protein n=1 Tax=Methanolobus mangrovi TaxID=3072977 RepID=A0AA51UE87_9EURY|nr:DUF166 domain-containing protein [Methanolobus mangrovi]WMW21354.1 DUF166 domain-containing protein [Methanolobus mangrovi]